MGFVLVTKNTKFAREALISFGILIRYQRDSLQKRLATNPTWLDSSIARQLVVRRRDAGTGGGGQEGQLPPLPFAGRGKGGKGAL